MSREKISGCVNAMRQYRKKEKIFLKNSLSLDIDDFRLKGWMPVKITGCLIPGRKKCLLLPPTKREVEIS
jgi:hypothetical protein